MGGAVFPPCCLTWGQTMVEAMKTMETSFERSHDALLHSVSRPRSRSPPTHAPTRDSWTLMGKSGPVSCGITAPFSWALGTQGYVCALQESVSPVLCRFWWLYGEVNGNPLKEGLCHTQVYWTQSPCSSPLLTHTSARDTQTQFWLSLWVLVCTRFVWALRASLAGMGFDSKHNFTLRTIFLGLLLCPWMWSIFLVGSNILLLMVVQQQVVILELLQGRMNARPSTPPSLSFA